MKKLPFIFLLSFIYLFFPTNDVSAQTSNTFSCGFEGPASQPCIVNVSLSDPFCDYSGGSPQQEFCAQFNEDEDACNDANGYCQSCNAPKECFEGGCPAGTHHEVTGTCSSSTATCCLDNDEEPPTPDVCFKCEVESFGGHYCYAVDATGDDCSPYWEDRNDCVQGCEEIDTFTNFACDKSGVPQCVPAATGEFTGDTAYTDCQEVCFAPSYYPEIYCEGQLPEEGGTINPARQTIWTAIGCIRTTSFGSFTVDFLKIGVSIGGGIALLMLAISGIMIKMSAANPDRLKAGKALAWGALSALFMMIFSAFLLRIAGITILEIPGF